jgi:glutamine synthetase
LKVVGVAFRESAKVRFEGNNYSDAWVREAKKRGLLNLRRTPEALAQMMTKQSRELFASLGILSKEELEARYNVRVERYIKDMLIELHTLEQIANTQVLPAALGYAGDLAKAAADAKAAGISATAHVTSANEIGKLATSLQRGLAALRKAIEKAEHMHDNPDGAAAFLTSAGADSMAVVREACDALELRVDDARWPLPRYREMLFPV